MFNDDTIQKLSRETVPSDFYSSFGPWLLHGFARTESYSISLNEDSSLELELSSTKCNEEKELSFPSIRHTPFRYKLLCEKFQQTIYFQGVSREESVYPRTEG